MRRIFLRRRNHASAFVNPVVKIQRVRNSKLPLPAYHSEHAAGFDLQADLDEPLTLHSMSRVAIPTGVALEIPPGFEGQVRPRSGRALEEGLTLANSPGTIDADYRGELKVILINLGDRAITINPGDRIAQVIIASVAHAELKEVDALEASPRGAGGFGHTGR